MSGSDGPIFLAGVDRSGIGLLGEILESHSRIAISRRTNFWSFYYGRFGDLRQPDNLARCVAEMMRDRRVRDLQPDPEALVEEVRRGEPTYPRLFAAIQEQNLRRLGKVRWGDKSLESERHAATIFREFPDARMLHVVRDPRDRYASRATHRRAGRGKVGAATATWLWSIRLAERHRRRYRGRYTVVRYEDLVTRPREVILAVCDFIEERFEPQMLTPRSFPDRDDPGPPRRLTSASVDRYRHDLPAREVAFVNVVARRRMRHLGYGVTPPGMSWGDRIAFVLGDLPLNTGRMAASSLGRLPERRTRTGPSGRRTTDVRTATGS